MSGPARPADVDEICASMPGAEKGITWGDRPSWLATGNKKPRSFVLERAPHRTAVDEDGELYTDLLVVVVPDAAAKAALVEGEGPFFTVPHFDGYQAVLVQQSRLGEISRDELVEVITDAWAAVAPKRLVKEHLGG